MRKLCFGQEWLLYVLTVGLSIGFAIAGLYALSASGDIRRSFNQMKKSFSFKGNAEREKAFDEDDVFNEDMEKTKNVLDNLF